MRKHPYITATILATLFSIVVWLIVPKDYSAVTKISDEYKEVDLAIGMNMLRAHMKALTGGANTGMNDMRTYCKVLKTEDFARLISHKQLPNKHMTYGQYLAVEDTIETIKQNILYNYSGKQSTLTISFTDKDPLIASLMLDSVTAQLQSIVTDYRHKQAKVALDQAKREYQITEKEYHRAQEEYASFADANQEAELADIQLKIDSLQKNTETTFKRFENASNELTRQQALISRPYISFAVIKSNSVPVDDNRHFLIYFVVIVTIVLLATKGIILYRKRIKMDSDNNYGDFFSPWSLTIFIWGADIALYFMQGTLDPVGPQFILCFTVWMATLLPSMLITFWLTKNQNTATTNFRKPLDVPRTLFNVLCVLSGIFTLMYAIRVWGIVSRFDLANLLYNLRVYIVEDNSAVGLLHHVQGLNFALFVIALWMTPKISKWQLTYIVLVNLVFEIFRMEKSGILIMILGTIFVLYERRIIKKRTILLTFVGIIILFFFFNLSKENVDTTQDTTFLDFFSMYVTSPMVAFEHLVPDISDTIGENTFCIIYPYLNMLGFDLHYTERLQEFVMVPIFTNVYTIMQPFYNDFGIPGIAFFGLVYGVLFGWVYRRTLEGDPVFVCIYTYLVQVILIQFYNDNLLQNIVLFLEFCFFIAVLTQQKFRLTSIRT